MSENKITVTEVFKACSGPGYSIKANGQDIDFVEHEENGICVAVCPAEVGEVLFFEEDQINREAELDEEGKMKLIHNEQDGTQREVEFQFLKIIPLPLGVLLARKLKGQGNETEPVKPGLLDKATYEGMGFGSPQTFWRTPGLTPWYDTLKFAHALLSRVVRPPYNEEIKTTHKGEKK
jgi:hypothetical protein